jgi:hypothetical protein
MEHSKPSPRVTSKPRAIYETTAITAHLARVIAASAAVDPRTVRAYLAKRRVSSTCTARIEQALLELGLGNRRRQPAGCERRRA